MKRCKTYSESFTKGLFSDLHFTQAKNDPDWNKISIELSSFIQASPCVWMVTDLLKNQWGWVSENAEALFGIHPRHLLYPGPSWFVPMIPSIYQDEVTSTIESIWEHIKNRYKSENQLCNYNLCFPVKLPNGREKEILQQNTFYLPERYQCSYLLSIYSDISSLQVKKSIHATVLLGSYSQDICPKACQSHQPHFSKREREISVLLKKGYSSKCIADRLHISFHTVNKHRQNMMEKSGAKNTAELMAMVE
ncbi:helix-turn-helix transcriptional regulator [Cyclobacterium roseum]|uniref:helix-turn-helix transcriptional regulator n=1 Tax=Cyclobacterium roseum TaxID=2666137 RepID=UPI0013908C13|nr:helix-turn-helix transcriptional regulator [Cyclobacterium roseum]